MWSTNRIDVTVLKVNGNCYDMLQRVYRLFDDDDDESADVANLPNSNPDGTSRNQFNEASSLSWDLRIQCFLGCLILSLVCSLGGSALLFAWKLTGFTVMVSLGSILSLVGEAVLSLCCNWFS
ncbi:unnamed protein product [Litomosoides sigmodontis]|uniref:Uncharacterized protein n=1 Tax=Litomosoides sigmodontis TaxID=42156 RepID=A0A3P6TLK4_LITSI|nr:unnamed protein product [Litomosoides sigmodontis]